MTEDPATGPQAGPGLDAPVHPVTLRRALHAAPVAMLLSREDGTIVFANRAAERLFGYEEGELRGVSVEALVPPRLRAQHHGLRSDFSRDPKARPMGAERDLVGVTRAGVELPLEIGLGPVATTEGSMILAVAVDLSLRVRLEQRMAELVERLGKKNRDLQHLVATDLLTSLKSRRAFLDDLSTQIEMAVRHARPLSLLILDVDRFKDYNDEFGHLEGDEVLRRVGLILLDVARRSDIVARIGGEEFGIILPETDDRGAVVIAERFRSAIEEGEWPLRPITASLGATTVDFGRPVPRPDAPDISFLLREADRALYWSKEEGRNRVTHANQITEEV